jgi:hypothetical protein
LFIKFFVFKDDKFLQDTAEIRTVKGQPGPPQAEGRNLIWLGKIEREAAKLSKTTFITVLPLIYFMGLFSTFLVSLLL